MMLSIICMLILTANTCQREGEDCHYNLLIRNNSGDSVKMAYRFYYDEFCVLQGLTLKAGEAYTEHLSQQCWEDRLSGGNVQDIYIVEPSQFNDQNSYYDCDSIEIKNKVLKHYVLTLEDIKKSNFIITYP